MDRRKFIQHSAIAGFAATQLSLVGCETAPKTGTPATPPPDNFIFNEITIGELQDKMKSGEYTARKIVEIYLQRIAEIDKSGPAINAIIELNPDALAIADTLDAERKSGKLRGPMHGIPVLLKDNINTGDKMQTTAGSLALEGHQATKDAFIVQRLREAGAIILGKTNLSEWTNFRSTRSSRAFNIID